MKSDATTLFNENQLALKNQLERSNYFLPVRPLVSIGYDGNERVTASCVALKYKRRSFIITAKHAIDFLNEQFKSQSVFLEENNYQQFNEGYFFCNSLDIAVIELPDGSQLEENCFFDLDLLRQLDFDEFSSFLCYGFPVSKNKKFKYKNFKPYAFSTVHARQSDIDEVNNKSIDGLYNYSQYLHFACQAHVSISINENGDEKKSIETTGASGGAIIYTGQFRDIVRGNKTKPQLAGIYLAIYNKLESSNTKCLIVGSRISKIEIALDKYLNEKTDARNLG
jgi:hypothetical protein